MSDYLIYYLELNMERSILTFKKHRLLTQCHTVENMEINRDKPLRNRLKMDHSIWLYVRIVTLQSSLSKKTFCLVHPQVRILML